MTCFFALAHNVSLRTASANSQPAHVSRQTTAMSAGLMPSFGCIAAVSNPASSIHWTWMANVSLSRSFRSRSTCPGGSASVASAMRLMTSISRFMPTLLGVVGRVGASIVARAGAGTRCKVTGGAHACYPTTMRCSLRRALTSSAEALPVTCMRVVAVSSQAFMRSALKPWRSHSMTVAMWAKNSSRAVTRSCRASISVGAGLGVAGVLALVMVRSFKGEGVWL